MSRRLLLIAGFGLALSLPVAAQSLPEWAAPSGVAPSAPAPAAPAETNGPGLPNTPKQVPVDGGLGLLALAGGAYALNKLRRRPNEA